MAHVMDPQPPAAADAQLHEWLALTPEEPLEPQLEIVDPHHHLCAHHPPPHPTPTPVPPSAADRGRVAAGDARAGEGGAHITQDRPGGPVDPAAVSYGEPNPAGCQQRYLLDDVVADIRGSGHNVTHTVFVECGAMFGKSGPAHLRPLGETLFAQGTASAAASGTYGDALICAGITGTFDMSLPQETLEATLEAFRAVPNFRGVRTGPSDAGLALLEKHGLVFETGLGAGAAEIAKKHPNLKIVCNHCCGRPSSGEEVTTTKTAC